jgi:hypothetical protein
VDCRLRDVGLGRAVGEGRTAYWVQDFGAR